MTPMQPTSEPSGGPSPEPGERRRLERPPSERYQGSGGEAAAEASAGATSAAATAEETTAAVLPLRERVLRGMAVGLAGVIVLTILGGPLSVTVGLVGAAGGIGWIIGMVARPGRAVAAGLAVASVALGLVGIWLFAGIEGGALGLVDYLAQVQGFLVPIELAVAGLLAAVSAGS